MRKLAGSMHTSYSKLRPVIFPETWLIKGSTTYHSLIAGPSARPVSSLGRSTNTVLTVNNIDSCRKDMPSEKLPQAFQRAIGVCALLGFGPPERTTRLVGAKCRHGRPLQARMDEHRRLLIRPMRRNSSMITPTHALHVFSDSAQIPARVVDSLGADHGQSSENIPGHLGIWPQVGSGLTSRRQLKCWTGSFQVSPWRRPLPDVRDVEVSLATDFAFGSAKGVWPWI